MRWFSILVVLLLALAQPASPCLAISLRKGPMDTIYSVEGGQFAATMRIVYDGERYMRVIQVFKGEVGGKPVPVATDYLFDMQKMMGYLHSPQKHQWLPE